MLFHSLPIDGLLAFVRLSGRKRVLFGAMIALCSGLASYAQLTGTRFSIDDAGSVQLKYYGSDDAYYIVKRGDSLVGVFTIRDMALGQAQVIDFTDGVNPLADVYYQVDEVPLTRPLDSDRDGIDDAFELAHPAILDPLDPSDSALDSDNDGISNFEEYARGTDIAAVSNIAPKVNLISPSSGSGFVQPASIQLAATASDPDGSIARVEFYHGDQKLGEDTSAPFEFSWSGVLEGDYVLTAVATDDAGSTATTLGSLVSVVDGANEPLTIVERTSPLIGEQGVAVTRETIITLSNPLAADAIVDSNVVSVNEGGEALNARIEVSKDRRKIRVFYDARLPSNSRINGVFNGSLVNDLLGRQIDADGDGNAGGLYEFFYETLNTVSLANTAVCGRVFASQLAPGNNAESVNVPLAGVKVSVDGQEDTLFTFTDEFGDFRLDNAPAGRFFVHIDGREVTRLADNIRYPDLAYYPNVGKAWVSIPNEEVNVGEVYLPLINEASLQEVSSEEATSISFPLDVIRNNPELKDISIEVPPNSLFRDDGTRGGMVGIAPVPPDRLPGQLPEGLDFPVVITVQTDGATNFDTPVPMCAPNLDGLDPGDKTALWSFNHDTGQFEVVGPATVSADGTLVCTDPGVGITAPGWHGFIDRIMISLGRMFGFTWAPPPRPKPDTKQECTENDKDACCVCKTKNSVLLHSGEERFTRLDLRIPGRAGMDFVMQRTYRSRLSFDGPLGYGWSYDFNEALFIEDNGDVTRANGSAHVDRWELQPDGSFKAPTGHFRTLIKNLEGNYVLREADGFKRYYHPDGRLFCHEDRFGNRMLFEYDARGNLDKVIDVYGREIDFVFQEFASSPDRLVAVRDFADREIIYTYDERGDLVSVRTPVVEGTSTGNDFPNGRTEVYTYSSGFDHPSLNHNLLSVTRPEEVANGGAPALQWEYGTDENDPLTFDKVIREIEGGTNDSGVSAGGDRVFTYEVLNENEPEGNFELPRGKATIVERNGNITEYFINERQQHIITKHLTRGFRENEPDSFDTISEYNEDGLLLRRIFPEGNSETYVYDTDGQRHMQNNILEVRKIADQIRGGGEDLVTQYTYEPLFNRVSTRTDPRGFANGFTPPIGGQSQARYTSWNFFDYQESDEPVESAELFGIVLDDIERGLGDLNGDGRTDQMFGNLIRIEAPVVELLPESNQAASLGSTSQNIVTELRWNDHGQLIATIDPEGNVTRNSYYPEFDPNGDGIRTNSIYKALGSQNNGYLRSTIVDAEDTSRRTTELDPLALKTSYVYDEVGNVISETNPRGVVTSFEVNQLNEVVVYTLGARVNQAKATGQLLTEESSFAFRHELVYDHNGRVIGNRIENRDLSTPGVGGFVDETTVYDILGNPISRSREVDSDTVLTTHYRYDANENPIRIQQPEGNISTATYDERDLKLTSTAGKDSDEQSTSTYTYDGNSNLILVEDAEDNDGDGNPEFQSIEYDGFDRNIALIDALGNRTSLSYDPASNVVQTRFFGHPPGQPDQPNVLLADTRFHYDELNRAFASDSSLFVSDAFQPQRAPTLSDHDSDGFVTELFEFDALGRLTHVVEDDLQTTEYVYDGASRKIAKVDALGNTVVNEFDNNGNAVAVSSIELSEDGLVKEEQYVTRYVYDQLDRLVRATDNAGQTTYFEYDSRSNLIRRQDPVGALTNDPLGLISNQINLPGNSIRMVYDGLDRIVEEIRDLRANGVGSESLDTGNQFNSDGQVSIKYEWDGNSRLAGRVDDNGNRTRFEYDALNRRVQQVNAIETEVYSWTYDRDHNVIQMIDPNGTVCSYEYDAINRKVSTNIARASGVQGTVSETIEYDGLSRVTRIVDDNGPNADQESEYIYDSLGRVIEEIQNGQAVSRAYLGDGRENTIVYPGGRMITRSYDGIDRVREILDETSGTPELISDSSWIGPGYRELHREFGNGAQLSFLNAGETESIGYDAVRRLVRLRIDGPQTQGILDREYGYNRANMRVSEKRNDDGQQTDSFSYDSLYRVAQANYDTDGNGGSRDVSKAEYRYDGVGNRRVVETLSQVGGSVSVDLQINEVNEYVSVGSVSRIHSDNGNLKDDGSREYVYDYKNRLVSVIDKSDGSTVSEYLYYGDNRRSVKIVGGSETRYYYDGDQVVEERNGSGDPIVTYVYAPNYIDAPMQLSRTSAHPLGEGVVYLHQNDRSDVVLATNDQGGVAEKRYFDDFGQSYDDSKSQVTISAVGNPFGFQGRRLDEETGLYYFRNRYYDPTNGRFLQRDPVWDSANAGNQYAFAGNSPLSGSDPYGLKGIFKTAWDYWTDKLTPAPPKRPPWWNKPGGFNQTGANTLSAPTPPAPPPVPVETITEESFLEEVAKVHAEIESQHEGGKSYVEIAMNIDSKYLKEPEGKYDKVCFRGRVMTRAQINYYFQGMTWAMVGVGRNQMFSIIAGYKQSKVDSSKSKGGYQRETKDELWAAELGMLNYERDLRMAERMKKGEDPCPGEPLIRPPEDPTDGLWRKWTLWRGATFWKWGGQAVGLL